MKRSADMADATGKIQSEMRDLFGQKSPPVPAPDAKSRGLALDLRAMSERAYRAGLGRSSSLIEIAAMMVELEGSAVAQDEPEV